MLSPTRPSPRRRARSASQAERRQARRGDEARVEEQGADGDAGGAPGRPETGEPAAGRGRGDPEDDQRVPERPPPQRAERDGDDRERPERVREDREQAGREKREVILRRRDPVGGERAVHGHREGDSDCEPRIRERDRRGPAASGQQEGAGAEQRRRQQRAGGVVDAEGAPVPACRLAPGDRRGGDRVRGEGPSPGEQLRPAARALPGGEEPGEPQREERGGEGDERVHET